MDQATFVFLKGRVRGDWIRFECHRLDFLDASRRSRKGAKFLAWLTIVLAVLTTVSSGAAVEKSGELAWAATALAALTTLAATIRQTFKWEEKAQLFYGKALEIAQVQRTLQDYLEGIARGTREEDITFMSTQSSRLDKLLDPDVDDPDRFSSRAVAEWDRSHSSLLNLGPPQDPPPVEPDPAPLPEPPPEVGEAVADTGLEVIRRGGSRA